MGQWRPGCRSDVPGTQRRDRGGGHSNARGALPVHEEQPEGYVWRPQALQASAVGRQHEVPQGTAAGAGRAALPSELRGVVPSLGQRGCAKEDEGDPKGSSARYGGCGWAKGGAGFTGTQEPHHATAVRVSTHHEGEADVRRDSGEACPTSTSSALEDIFRHASKPLYYPQPASKPRVPIVPGGRSKPAAGRGDVQEGHGSDLGTTKHPLIKLNALPKHTVNAAAIRTRCPSPRGRLAIGAHIDDGVARTMLAPLKKGADMGPSSVGMDWVMREAVIADNAKVTNEVDHLHRMFLRVKRDGVSARLIVDGTDGGSSNALNSRMPLPVPPPALMRIQTVVLILMSRSVFGVDDVRTAFNTFLLCGIMQRAIGVAFVRGAGAQCKGCMTRMIQGGSWSAVTCQYSILTASLPVRFLPMYERQHVNPHDWSAQRHRGVDFFGACVASRRLVHIDDVMSAGHDAAQLDAERQIMRERATRDFGIMWKESQPSGTTGRAVGVWLDLTSKSWTVDPEWAQRVMTALPKAHDDEWLCGVAEWITQVLHAPGMIRAAMRMAPSGGERYLEVMLRTTARYRRRLEPEQALRPWPRGNGKVYVQGDAMNHGYAVATSEGVSVAGTWWRCGKTNALSVSACCHTAKSSSTIPAEMVRAEALTTAEGVWLACHGEGGQLPAARYGDDLFVISDNKPWIDALISAHSESDDVLAVIVAVFLVASGHVAAAHVPGESNVADAHRGR